MSKTVMILIFGLAFAAWLTWIWVPIWPFELAWGVGDGLFGLGGGLLAAALSIIGVMFAIALSVLAVLLAVPLALIGVVLGLVVAAVAVVATLGLIALPLLLPLALVFGLIWLALRPRPPAPLPALPRPASA